jgi:hypothetical protein
MDKAALLKQALEKHYSSKSEDKPKKSSKKESYIQSRMFKLNPHTRQFERTSLDGEVEVMSPVRAVEAFAKHYSNHSQLHNPAAIKKEFIKDLMKEGLSKQEAEAKAEMYIHHILNKAIEHKQSLEEEY